MSINAGKTRVKGLDVDGFIAIGDQFKFTFAGNLLDPESRGVTIPAELLPYQTGSVIGFDFVAKHTYSLGGEFNTEIGNFGKFTANLDLYHSGPASFTDMTFPSYTVVNGRIGLNNVGGMPIDLSIYGTNIFNKTYIAQGAFNGPNAGVESSIFGAPAQYGATVRYRF